LSELLDGRFDSMHLPIAHASAPADGQEWLVNALHEGPIAMRATHGLLDAAVEVSRPVLPHGLSR
jgi:hypothetical protein